LTETVIAVVVSEIAAFIVQRAGHEAGIGLGVALQKEILALGIVVTAVTDVTTDPGYLVAVAGRAVRVAVTGALARE
jgi:hypothetical protein